MCKIDWGSIIHYIFIFGFISFGLYLFNLTFKVMSFKTFDKEIAFNNEYKSLRKKWINRSFLFLLYVLSYMAVLAVFGRKLF